ncbi:MAG: DUF6377 domain-containing protein [Muribaculaceae bacterium]
MNTKITILLAIVCLNINLIRGNTITKGDINDLLTQIDEIINEGDKYQLQRVHYADSLYRVARRSKGYDKIDAYKQIYNLYSHFQSDSALRAIKLIEQTDEAKQDKNIQDFTLISRGEIMGLMGLYVEAYETLNSVDESSLSKENRLFLFQTYRSVYGWIADYASSNNGTAEKYVAMTNTYRDSILSAETYKVSYDIALADKYIVNDNAEDALQILLSDLETAHDEELVYLYFNLAEAYRKLGDEDKQIYYLAKASICDLKAGVTEYLALPTLAHILYKRGDVERAYQYIIRSMDDANFCRARLRTMEVSNIFPIIDKAYKQFELEHRKGVRIFTIILIVLVVLLLCVIAFVLKQNNKLTITRTKLAEANSNLQSVNNELQNANTNLVKADRVKEEYIALFLERCRSYLDALENYRHSLLKLAKNNQHDAMLRQLKDHTQIGEEQQRFYHDFDKAFLDIHPNFVTNFNNLLKEEERVVPKNENTLTTEMRIFALIRLGINDSNNIAHFLNYSLATIYNYRSRITNKSTYDKDEFNERLMKC